MKRSLICTLGCSLALLSCSREKETGADPVTPGTATTPVETNAPNTSYQPAFPGQTRVSGVTTAPNNYRATVVTSSLTSPWGITSLPDGRLLVTEKSGRMRLVTPAGAVSEPITGIPQ